MQTKQGRNESVSQYSLRVESCLAKLLTEINISIPTKKKDELAGRLAAMQDLALNVFIIGLQPPLATVVRCRDPSTINEAINFTTAEEKFIGMTVKRQFGPSTSTHAECRPTNNQPFPRPQFQPQSNFRRNTAVCWYCKNVGHTIENCRKRQFNNDRRMQYTPNPNYSQGTPRYPNRVHFVNDNNAGYSNPNQTTPTNEHLNE